MVFHVEILPSANADHDSFVVGYPGVGPAATPPSTPAENANKHHAAPSTTGKDKTTPYLQGVVKVSHSGHNARKLETATINFHGAMTTTNGPATSVAAGTFGNHGTTTLVDMTGSLRHGEAELIVKGNNEPLLLPFKIPLPSGDQALPPSVEGDVHGSRLPHAFNIRYTLKASIVESGILHINHDHAIPLIHFPRYTTTDLHNLRTPKPITSIHKLESPNPQVDLITKINATTFAPGDDKIDIEISTKPAAVIHSVETKLVEIREVKGDVVGWVNTHQNEPIWSTYIIESISDKDQRDVAEIKTVLDSNTGKNVVKQELVVPKLRTCHLVGESVAAPIVVDGVNPSGTYLKSVHGVAVPSRLPATVVRHMVLVKVVFDGGADGAVKEVLVSIPVVVVGYSRKVGEHAAGVVEEVHGGLLGKLMHAVHLA
ncbi:hypothetical protein HDU76_006457 [Blyttiomyces sp. JEL0837]|nr:hypothetical protein HDU76_006457 [Blyttiomyces sp. JEL0837]